VRAELDQREGDYGMSWGDYGMSGLSLVAVGFLI
jgi:hypothetical protein